MNRKTVNERLYVKIVNFRSSLFYDRMFCVYIHPLTTLSSSLFFQLGRHSTVQNPLINRDADEDDR